MLWQMLALANCHRGPICKAVACFPCMSTAIESTGSWFKVKLEYILSAISAIISKRNNLRRLNTPSSILQDNAACRNRSSASLLSSTKSTFCECVKIRFAGSFSLHYKTRNELQEIGLNEKYHEKSKALKMGFTCRS